MKPVPPYPRSHDRVRKALLYDCCFKKDVEQKLLELLDPQIVFDKNAPGITMLKEADVMENCCIGKCMNVVFLP